MTKQEEHELLIRLDERTEAMLGSLKALCESQALQNGRIDKLESWRDKIIGGSVVYGLLVGVASPIITVFVVKWIQTL